MAAKADSASASRMARAAGPAVLVRTASMRSTPSQRSSGRTGCALRRASWDGSRKIPRKIDLSICSMRIQWSYCGASVWALRRGIVWPGQWAMSLLPRMDSIPRYRRWQTRCVHQYTCACFSMLIEDSLVGSAQLDSCRARRGDEASFPRRAG